MFSPRSPWIKTLVALTVLVLALTACGSDNDEDTGGEGANPTLPVSTTVLTNTPFSTFTPFPTSTQYQPLVPPPSATAISLLPTVQQIIPTSTPIPIPTLTSLPYDVRISYPVDGSTVAGYVTVVGSASHPRFVQYALEWGPDPNPGNLWYPFGAPRTATVLNNALGAWNTTAVPDGVYQIRVHVWLNDGTDTDDIVTRIRVSNSTATPAPTTTPTARPNNQPVIQPIAGQAVDAGSAVTVNVTATDPDGDALNLFVSSSYPAIATVQVVGTSQLLVSGVTAGDATITVTANDNRGGTASAAFLVTVRGQNRAPTFAALSPQSLEVGIVFDVPVSVADPDGDLITLSAASQAPQIVSATILENRAVRLQGVAAGTTSVSVTALDARGAQAVVSFPVTVGAVNAPPVLQPIQPQALANGETRDVPYTAFDPDNDALLPLVTSSDDSVVTASVIQQGVVRLTAQGAGAATVTLTVSDQRHDPVSMPFNVSVAAPNQPPTVDSIPGLALGGGETREVQYAAFDPEGDSLTAAVQSDNPAVASVEVAGDGLLRVTAQGAGTATVALSVTDGQHDPVVVQFSVSVAEANLPPVVDQIQSQTMAPGEIRDVPYSAVDPNGDVLSASVESSDPNVARASIAGDGVIRLAAQNVGDATVTLSVADGINVPVTMSFVVTVAQDNLPPAVDPIPAVALGVGETRQVGYNAVDPNGDPLTVDVQSDNPAVVAVSVVQPGLLEVTGQAAGAATVTLSVSDGVNPSVGVTFAVTVQQGNLAPVIEPIASQSVAQGDTLSVPVIASDPDLDAVALVAVSDTPGIATAQINGTAVDIVGMAPGSALVTVDGDDGRGGTASVSFTVEVTGVNNTPLIDPIAEQQLSTGEEITVSVFVSDADGDPLVLTALAQDMNVVQAESVGTDTVILRGLNPGQTAVDLTADDGRGGVANASFMVTVASAAPSFDLTVYPVVPQFDAQTAQWLQLTYQGGLSLGNQPNAFAKIGDESVSSSNFMAPYATVGQAQLGNFAGLEGMIDLYRNTAVHGGDVAVNSFNVDSVAAESGFGVDSLSVAAPAGPPCDQTGASSVLGCELAATAPSIALISFSAPNVTFLPPEQFRGELQSIVLQTLQTYGAIPVLATVPEQAGFSSEQLAEYNRVIVEVALESQVPLWNLWLAMQQNGVADPFSVAPAGAGDLTDASLSYGYNVRNLTALQVLQAVRSAAVIQ